MYQIIITMILISYFLLILIRYIQPITTFSHNTSTFHSTSTPINGVLYQSFEWYLNNDSQHYNNIMSYIPELSHYGISALWLPPVSKGGAGTNDVGYGIYDMYDLGEFNQKGTIKTKYGNKQELIKLTKKLKEYNIDIYADMVYNHRVQGDEKEKFIVKKCDPNNRLIDISNEMWITSYTNFTFEGRDGKYSKFQFQSWHFTGTDVNIDTMEHGIYRILGKNKYWSLEVDKEYGNYDYLLANDLDLKHPEVEFELIKYTLWLKDQLNLNGIRFDAAKHIHLSFIKNIMKEMLIQGNENFFFVAEYWSGDVNVLIEFIKKFDYKIHLFDVSLHYNFYQASIEFEKYDLSKILDNTLVKDYPTQAVTFVDNHDTQLGQSLQSWVQDWFKLHAYCLILLRDQGYPTLFYGDYNGIINGPNKFKGFKLELKKLLLIRKLYNFGIQIDYFNHPNTIGWLRYNNNNNNNSDNSLFAVLLSNSKDGFKQMSFGSKFKHIKLIDIFNTTNEVELDSTGTAYFNVKSRKIAVFIKFDELSKFNELLL